MIPKVLHYIWFGGSELPELEKNASSLGRRSLPDWEIRRWDESNFDINQCDFSREAYASKKWAFVSDYARYKILYSEGGILLDTDVEVLKPLDGLFR